MGREIVQHDPDHRGFGIVNIDQIAHAVGEVLVGAPLGDLHSAPRPMGIEDDEIVGPPLHHPHALNRSGTASSKRR